MVSTTIAPGKITPGNAYDVGLDVQSVSKAYTGRGKVVQALDQVSLQVRPGEILGLLGPNGAGKTTLLSLVCGLDQADQGSIFVGGLNVQKEPLRTKQILGIVPQELVNHGFFNLRELLRYHSGYYGIRGNSDHCDELLKDLGLWDHREKLVRQLSGGMKRRFMIAKALVHKPRLLLLDEPTAGVDIELRSTLWKFVRRLRDQGVAIVLTTHYLSEAEELCEQVVIIDKGRVRFTGATASVIAERTRREVEILFSAGADLSALDRLQKAPVTPDVAPASGGTLPGAIWVVELAASKVVLSVPTALALGEVLAQIGVPLSFVYDLRTREGSLEDAFLSLTGTGAGPSSQSSPPPRK